MKDTKYLDTILKKQCEMVGADFSKMNFKKERWFWDYTWNEKQEDEFFKWLMEFLKDRKVWNNLTDYHNNNKRNRERFSQEWNLNYGWKLI